MPDQPIQFLLDQLATNEQDRERFNSANPFLIQLSRDEYGQLSLRIFNELRDLIINSSGEIMDFTVQKWFKYFPVIIRTCLSRVNNEAVLGVFEGTNQQLSLVKIQKENQNRNFYYDFSPKFKSEFLLFSYSYPIDNGKSLDEALQALDNKMLELVPEYVEFINNNK